MCLFFKKIKVRSNVVHFIDLINRDTPLFIKADFSDISVRLDSLTFNCLIRDNGLDEELEKLASVELSRYILSSKILVPYRVHRLDQNYHEVKYTLSVAGDKDIIENHKLKDKLYVLTQKCVNLQKLVDNYEKILNKDLRPWYIKIFDRFKK